MRKSGKATVGAYESTVNLLHLRVSSLFLLVISCPNAPFYFSLPLVFTLLALSIWFSF